jgi:protein-disulfide isomerase
MKKIIIPVVVCLTVMVVVIGVFQWTSLHADEVDIAPTEIVEITEDQVPAPVTKAQASIENGSFVIGAPDAPITIMEFSSLSCPHCATFHKNTLPTLKKDYVDRGQVKFVFNDFPLNKAAVDGSLLLKCVDLDNRYEFMEMLFAQQGEWAFAPDHRTKLKQYAALLGMGGDKADACMNDTDAERTMFENMQLNNAKYQVKSTPTFVVIPSEKVIKGAQNYGTFSTEIERLLAK